VACRACHGLDDGLSEQMIALVFRPALQRRNRPTHTDAASRCSATTSRTVACSTSVTGSSSRSRRSAWRAVVRSSSSIARVGAATSRSAAAALDTAAFAQRPRRALSRAEGSLAGSRSAAT
jgi:hypothetical protein